MSTYTHTLTELEIECGVTMEDVPRELARGVFRFEHFVVDKSLSPALAGSVARAAFGGKPVEYVGRTRLGRAYRVVR